VSSLLGQEIGLYPGWLFLSAIGIWQIEGVRRSAKRHGGFRARAATFTIALLFVGCMSSFKHMVKDEHRGLEIDQQHASSAPSAQPLIPADNKPAANTQPWKQVGEWEIRYDYLDAGDGTPSGCFMSRHYRSSALRIGIHGANNYIILTSANLNLKIENQKYYDLSLSFNEFTPWFIKTQAKTFASGNKYLVFHTSDQRFFAELVSSNSLTISQSGTAIFEFTVTGAKEALAAMLNCQESHRRDPTKTRDRNPISG
jgi:hypothetical protein